MENLPMSGNPNLFRELVTTFEAARLSYCLLANYDSYPECIGSDVDFMVARSHAPRVAQLLADAAARCNARLVQCVHHETTAVWFVLAREEASTLSFIQPDMCTDYRKRGRLWLLAEGIVARRRWHPRGFWVSSAADTFIYYLIKRLEKGVLSGVHAEELDRRYHEDPKTAQKMLLDHFPEEDAALIEQILLRHDHARLSASLSSLRDALHGHALSEALHQRVYQSIANQVRVMRRVLRPTGLSIAFLGPDGSGKSAVIERVQHELRDAFRRVHYQHLRPRPLAHTTSPNQAPVVDPHGQPARGTIGSIAKLIHFWAGYVVGALLWTFPRRTASTLVIFDRYYHDVLADPRRYRYGAPLFYARLMGRFVPQPDLVFVLDAPPEVVQARKQEVSISESVRQRAAYLDLATQLRATHVIDAAQPLDQVVAEVAKIVLTRLESRLAAQLELSQLTPVKEA
jgi:thymidylate kinase